MTQFPRTMSELAQAYYTERKTTIGKGEPLRYAFETAQNLPYFISAYTPVAQSAESKNSAERTRVFSFPKNAPINELFIRDFVKGMASREDVRVMTCTLVDGYSSEDHTDLVVGAFPSCDPERFQSFAKGLGILLRAATQHKRESVGVFEDYFL